MENNEVIIRMKKLQVLFDEYGFNFTQNDSWVLRDLETASGMTQKSKIYEFAVDLFVHLSEIAFKYSILAK